MAPPSAGPWRAGPSWPRCSLRLAHRAARPVPAEHAWPRPRYRDSPLTPRPVGRGGLPAKRHKRAAEQRGCGIPSGPKTLPRGCTTESGPGHRPGIRVGQPVQSRFSQRVARRDGCAGGSCTAAACTAVKRQQSRVQHGRAHILPLSSELAGVGEQ